LTDAYDIPANSVAVINENPLGTPSIEIKLGTIKPILLTARRYFTNCRK
jgi:hypothetical protein